MKDRKKFELFHPIIDIFTEKGAILHATRPENLESILEHGLLSRAARGWKITGIGLPGFAPLLQEALGDHWVSVYDWWRYLEERWTSYPNVYREEGYATFEEFVRHDLPFLIAPHKGGITLVISPEVERTDVREFRSQLDSHEYFEGEALVDWKIGVEKILGVVAKTQDKRMVTYGNESGILEWMCHVCERSTRPIPIYSPFGEVLWP